MNIKEITSHKLTKKDLLLIFVFILFVGGVDYIVDNQGLPRYITLAALVLGANLVNRYIYKK